MAETDLQEDAPPIGWQTWVTKLLLQLGVMNRSKNYKATWLPIWLMQFTIKSHCPAKWRCAVMHTAMHVVAIRGLFIEPASFRWLNLNTLAKTDFFHVYS